MKKCISKSPWNLAWYENKLNRFSKCIFLKIVFWTICPCLHMFNILLNSTHNFNPNVKDLSDDVCQTSPIIESVLTLPLSYNWLQTHITPFPPEWLAFWSQSLLSARQTGACCKPAEYLHGLEERKGLEWHNAAMCCLKSNGARPGVCAGTAALLFCCSQYRAILAYWQLTKTSGILICPFWRYSILKLKPLIHSLSRTLGLSLMRIVLYI